MANKKRNVLIVDDTRFSRTKIKEILMSKPEFAFMDLNIREACNGKEALLEIQNGNIDIVLLDINMPVMNGIELLAELKKLNITPEIIVITGDESITFTVLESYIINDLLYKPFDSKRLWENLIEINEKLVWNIKSNKNIQTKQSDSITQSIETKPIESLPIKKDSKSIGVSENTSKVISNTSSKEENKFKSADTSKKTLQQKKQKKEYSNKGDSNQKNSQAEHLGFDFNLIEKGLKEASKNSKRNESDKEKSDKELYKMSKGKKEAQVKINLDSPTLNQAANTNLKKETTEEDRKSVV